MSQSKATYVLNEFKKARTKEIIDRSSFVKREKQLNVEFYKSAYNIIEHELGNVYKKTLTKQVLVVDITHVNLSKKLAKDLKLN